MGLFLYDHLGGRKILPATKTLDLTNSPEGAPLSDEFTKAYEYSDCWVEDSRLVALNARDAAERGASILTRTKLVSARPEDGMWCATVVHVGSGHRRTIRARMVVNAGGPWVGDILRQRIGCNTRDDVRLVRGSHIVTRRLFDHDKCYFFQGSDGRIMFAIPYETDFTLIGTTDQEHHDLSQKPVCTPEEQRYMVDGVNAYLKTPISEDDIVWTYSGVRPLYDDGALSATAATRDYTIKLDESAGAPAVNIFGGKITTYRKLAESALAIIGERLGTDSGPWTAGVAMPGGDFAVGDVGKLVTELRRDYDFLTERWALRLIRAYGTDARKWLGTAKSAQDLGQDFGATLTAAEVDWLMEKEFAETAEDILWRRSKLGLHKPDAAALDAYMTQRRSSIKDTA